MIKSLMREAKLAFEARSGLTPGLFVWFAVAALATVTAFAFFCVAGYAWLAREFGDVFGGLIAAGFFLVIALLALLIAVSVRRRTKQRAMLERAANARGGSWLLDPKILATALQAGRSLGWQRLVPIVLLGFLAAQWAREYRRQDKEDTD